MKKLSMLFSKNKQESIENAVIFGMAAIAWSIMTHGLLLVEHGNQWKGFYDDAMALIAGWWLESSQHFLNYFHTNTMILNPAFRKDHWLLLTENLL